MSKDGMLLGEEIAGVNQILPHKHKSVWDIFLKSVANNWSPAEVNMSTDIKQWKGEELSNDEKLLVKSEDEYTSPIQKIFKIAEAYIIMTENSLYLVSSEIPTKKIS